MYAIPEILLESFDLVLGSDAPPTCGHGGVIAWRSSIDYYKLQIRRSGTGTRLRGTLIIWGSSHFCHTICITSCTIRGAGQPLA